MPWLQSSSHAWVILKELGQSLVDDPCGDSLHIAIGQLNLGLTLELGIGHMNADNRRESFLEVLAGDRQIFRLARAAVLPY